MILHFLLPFIYISLSFLASSAISGYVYPGYGFLPPLNASTPLINRTGCPLVWPNDGSLLCENGGFMYNYSVSQAKADFIYNLFQSSPDPVLYDFLLDNKTQNNFYFDEPGYIELTIVIDNGGYHNAIGLFMFNASNNNSVISQSFTDVWRDFSTQAAKGYELGHQRGDTVRLGPFPAKTNVGLYVFSDRNRLGIWWNRPSSCMNVQVNISSCISTFDFKNNPDYLYCYSKYDCILDPNMIFEVNPAALKFSIDSLNLKYNPAAYSQIPYRHFRMIKDAVSDEIYISFNDWTGGFYTGGTMIARVSRPQPHLPKLCSVVCDPAHGSCNFTTGTCSCQSGWGGADCSCVAPIGTCANAQPHPNTYNCATGQCNCLAGWKGNLCDCKEVCENNCQNGGTCLCDGNCGCTADWRGSADCSCRTPISGECKNAILSPNQYNCTTGTCNCLPEWSGDLCDTYSSTTTANTTSTSLFKESTTTALISTASTTSSSSGILSVSSFSTTPLATSKIVVSDFFSTTSGISSSESQSNTLLYILIGSAGGTLVAVIGAGILIYRHNRKRREPFQSLHQSSYSLKAASMNQQLNNPMMSYQQQPYSNHMAGNVSSPASYMTQGMTTTVKANNTQFGPLFVPGYSQLQIGVDFEISDSDKKLGSGGTASIFPGILINPALISKYQIQAIAVKIFNMDGSQARKNNNMRYEIAIMNLLKGVTNVVQFVGYTDQPFKSIIMKQYSGSLQTLIKTYNLEIQPEILVKIAGDIVNGMRAIHRLNILHLDLKPGNILWEEINGSISFSVSDFGFANIIGESRKMVSGMEAPRSIGVSLRYTAPEVFEYLRQNEVQGRVSSMSDKKIDVYAYGMTMYGVMQSEGGSFWKSLAANEIVAKIMKGERPDIHEIPKSLSESNPRTRKIIQIIQMCWNHNPSDRPSFENISI